VERKFQGKWVNNCSKKEKRSPKEKVKNTKRGALKPTTQKNRIGTKEKKVSRSYLGVIIRGVKKKTNEGEKKPTGGTFFSGGRT